MFYDEPGGRGYVDGKSKVTSLFSQALKCLEFVSTPRRERQGFEHPPEKRGVLNLRSSSSPLRKKIGFVMGAFCTNLGGGAVLGQLRVQTAQTLRVFL